MTVEIDTSVVDRVLAVYRGVNTLTRTADERLADTGLTFIQTMVLHQLVARGASQPRDVWQKMAVRSQAITGVLDRLERAGYVERVRDLHDRRAVRLVVTEKGRAAYEQAFPELVEVCAYYLGATQHEE